MKSRIQGISGAINRSSKNTEQTSVIQVLLFETSQNLARNVLGVGFDGYIRKERLKNEWL